MTRLAAGPRAIAPSPNDTPTHRQGASAPSPPLAGKHSHGRSPHPRLDLAPSGPRWPGARNRSPQNLYLRGDQRFSKISPNGLYTAVQSSDTIAFMGRAGTALKRTLEQHGISQGRLAAALQIGSSNVYRWCNEVRDPNGETIVAIVDALKQLNPAAARDFVQRYLGELID